MPKSLVDELTEQKRKVDFDTFDITVKELLSMVAEKNINIAPQYQRQFRWEQIRQSKYIESVFLGIPVPSLFMAANFDGTWELVDGVQRLSTLVHFGGKKELRKKLGLGGRLRLFGLDKLTRFNKKSFADLPDSIRLQFLLKGVKIVTISDKSDLKVRFDLFERLNTGGVALTAQEIRACIHRGQFNDFLENMAKISSFTNVVRLPTRKEIDGTREEYVLRFFAFLHNYKGFEHSVVEFLNKFMSSATKQFDYASNQKIFEDTFDALALKFPKGITRDRSTTPVNLYEAVAVGAGLAVKKSGKLNGSDPSSWLKNDDLRKATTGATNSQTQVSSRIEFCAKKFGWS